MLVLLLAFDLRSESLVSAFPGFVLLDLLNRHIRVSMLLLIGNNGVTTVVGVYLPVVQGCKFFQLKDYSHEIKI